VDWFLLILLILAVVAALILGYGLGSLSSSTTDEDDDETVEVEDPTPEQLGQLKQTLNLQKGSLTFKKGSIYHIVYENKKHIWKRLARWADLRQRLESADEVDREEKIEVTQQLPNPCLLFVQTGKGHVGFLRKEWKHAGSDQPYPPCCYPSDENPKGCQSFLRCVGVEK